MEINKLYNNCDGIFICSNTIDIINVNIVVMNFLLNTTCPKIPTIQAIGSILKNIFPYIHQYINITNSTHPSIASKYLNKILSFFFKNTTSFIKLYIKGKNISI